MYYVSLFTPGTPQMMPEASFPRRSVNLSILIDLEIKLVFALCVYYFSVPGGDVLPHHRFIESGVDCPLTVKGRRGSVTAIFLQQETTLSHSEE